MLSLGCFWCPTYRRTSEGRKFGTHNYCSTALTAPTPHLDRPPTPYLLTHVVQIPNNTPFLNTEYDTHIYDTGIVYMSTFDRVVFFHIIGCLLFWMKYCCTPPSILFFISTTAVSSTGTTTLCCCSCCSITHHLKPQPFSRCDHTYGTRIKIFAHPHI